MSAAKGRGKLPPPDDSGTNVDPDAVLRQRISFGTNPLAAPTPAHTPPTPRPDTGTGVYGQRPSSAPSPRGRKRDDPAGMKRASYYVSESAAQELDAAVDRVMAALGDVPKHVVLSALIEAAARSADQVAAGLVRERSAALAEQLQRLQGGGA